MKQYTEDEQREREEKAETLMAIKQAKRYKNKTSALTVLRDVKENGCRRFRGMLIDHYSASAILAVYDALKKPEMKTQYEEIIESNLLKAQSIAFKLVK